MENEVCQIETSVALVSSKRKTAKFYFDKDDKEIVIPERSYELHDIRTT